MKLCSIRIYRSVGYAVAAFLFLAGGADPAWTYTQSGVSIGFANGIPMGHEWVTRMAGIELMGYVPATVPDIPDLKDPRKGWVEGLAKNLDLSSAGAQAELKRIKAAFYYDQRYASRYKPVFDAIIGERWVDLSGYNVATSHTCWDAVNQEPAEVQYDHFMRRYDDHGGKGGVKAAQQSQQRFIQYFVDAAMARPGQMAVYDGGAAGSATVEVDRNYFLFGRAAHLFQDSFSSEHTVRIPVDNYTRVRQVKSYLCAAGSEQHTHSLKEVLSYASGDVVWNPGTQLNPTWYGYKASNMKIPALVATEAMKDLWAAFIRVMGTPPAQRAAAATAEAQTLVGNWLSYDEQEMLGWYDAEANRGPTYVLAEGQGGKGQTVKACMAGLNVGTTDQIAHVKKLEALQRKCLYNAIPWAGYQDLFDPQLRIWYAWRWRNGSVGPLLDPPAGWKIQNQAADTGVPVRIKSVLNQQYMSAPDGIGNDAWIYCKAGKTPLDFIMVGTKDDAVFRVAGAPLLFLSYTNATGAVKLFKPSALALDPTNYKLSPAGSGWSIMNLYWKQYMWLYKSYESPYITKTGDPANPHSQWIIEGLAMP